MYALERMGKRKWRGQVNDVVACLAAALGQSVVVENRPGGAGSIAVLAVTQAKDNHTFGILTLQNAALPALDPKAAYDLRKDLQGVVLIATVPNILAVTQGMPVKTAAEFMAYAKANPARTSRSRH